MMGVYDAGGGSEDSFSASFGKREAGDFVRGEPGSRKHLADKAEVYAVGPGEVLVRDVSGTLGTVSFGVFLVVMEGRQKNSRQYDCQQKFREYKPSFLHRLQIYLVLLEIQNFTFSGMSRGDREKRKRG